MTRISTGGHTGALTLFAGNPSANLDQCANDPAPSPETDGCDSSATQWVNGNLGASKSVYVEGNSIPYRMLFDNLDNGAGNSHTVQIEWDTTKSGKHAIDYLTTWNRSVADADPCLGVSGCSGSPNTFPIPKDPQVDNGSGSPIHQAAGNFSMWGGTITGVSAYTYPVGSGFSGDTSADIVITFTATSANPVLAWGGHIADHHDWGSGNAAVAISGSPYHTRLIGLDGSGGNQDRSLSADAVIFPGTITIVKHASPTDATAAFGFTASSPLSPASFNLDGSNSGTTNVQLFSNIRTFQAYTFNEATVPSGWSFNDASCTVSNANTGTSSVSGAQVTVNLTEGEDWTCTYNNTRATKLTLVKSVTNNNGGTALPSAWTLAANAGGDANNFSGTTGVNHAVTPGVAYSLSESGGPNGYTLTGWSCNGGTQSGASITLATGDNVTCTATNDDVAPQLHLRKVVTNNDGGSAAPTDWTLTATGPMTLSGSTPVDSGSDFSAGTYALSELGGPSGYTLTGWSCTGGGSQNGASITLGLGDNVTCTATNDDNAPQLKLVKVVQNNDGGTAGPADFTLSAAASGGSGSGRDFTSKTASPAFHNVFAGTAYTLSESGPAGYSQSGGWSCDGGTQSGSSITLAPGTTVTCTATNTDDTPQLKLVKVVDNTNGGSAGPADFTLGATAGGARDFTSATASPVFHDVFAGATYTLSDTGGPAGYTAGQWSCDGGTMNSGKTTVTVALGAHVTCTITNTSQAPQLKLVKNVINDDGGTATADQWTLHAVAASPNDGRNFTSASTTPTFHQVFAGASYSLSESGGPAGYTSDGTWTCDSGTLNADKNAITLAPGASATCTITNNDNGPQLKLVKNVVNANGGTATAADFTLSAAASGGNAARDFTSTSATPIFHDVFANQTYNLSETGPAGYTTTGQWTCDGGTLNAGKNAVTVAVGTQVTCTLTNTDVAPQLKLVKHVVNDDGGTATADQWTLHADAVSPNDGRNFTSASATPSFNTVFANATYDLSESGGPAGYSSDGIWTCDGGTMNQAGNAVTLPLGAQVTCTITNNDNGPQLKLVKNVVNDNGGTATAADWTLSATAASGSATRDFTSKTDTPSFHDVFAGVSYDLAEAGGPDAYSSTGKWACEGGTMNDAQTAVTVALGEQVTCTITNDDIGPTITVTKQLVPATDSGTFDFSITQGESKTTLDNGGKGYGHLGSTGPVTVDAGSATVSEAGHGSTNAGDYTSTWSCSNEQSGTGTSLDLSNLAIGDSVSCTFVNTRLATLIVKKVVDNSNGGGSKSPADFTLHVSTAGLEIGKAAGSSSGTPYSGLLPGTYRVTEDAVSGYSLTSATCDNGGNPTSGVQLNAGQTVTCTLTNTSAAPPPPPPPPPPAPKIDLSITKTGAPNPTTVNKNITWTMVVVNNGPNNATGVTVADPIPAGTTYVSSTTSQGTCTGGTMLSCSLGSLAVGNSVTVSLVTTANQTGTIPNTATVVGNEAETNTANNTASASVNVVGVFKPPVVYCTAVAVSPKQLFVGRTNTLKMRLTQHGKAAKSVRVRIKGSTISVTTKPSNRHGLVTRKVKPMKAGIVTFTPVASKRCNAPRVGVIGVFTPPVTG